ncbi:histidine kinase [Streptomyces sp. NPDC046866]|uniref:sensor histidine kinase n=1 Tax=Streptomyces sp. NPDC046866 TaxID=3154921 RepID=UPI0034548B6E
MSVKLRARLLYAPLALVTGALCLACSLAGAPAAWLLTGAVLLLPLLTLAARWAPARRAVAACAVGVAGVALWPVPFLLDARAEFSSEGGWGLWLELAGAAAFWSLPALGAVAVGCYLRFQAARLRHAVREARRDQQLELARDLHDFVAHDVSAIVVQAQAARFVADGDPGRALPALERIEAAGLSALASMDRTVHALRAAVGGPTAPAPGLDALPELVGRFDGAVLEAGPGAPGALSREADAAAYRVAVEALTNVRRHAPGASAVRVDLRRAAAGTELAVSNSAPARGSRSLLARRWRQGGGTGLAGLRERVEAAGGRLDAGPDGAGGWRVLAVFPAVDRDGR